MPLDQAAFWHGRFVSNHLLRVQSCQAFLFSPWGGACPRYAHESTHQATRAALQTPWVQRAGNVQRARVGSTVRCPWEGPGTRQVTCQRRGPKTNRRRGGIEPLRVSTPHELKSCPSTSPTHPGPYAETLAMCTCAGAWGSLAGLPHAQYKYTWERSDGGDHGRLVEPLTNSKERCSSSSRPRRGMGCSGN